MDGVERREWFGLPVDDKLRSLNVSPFPSIFSSKANRRAATKSAFCVCGCFFKSLRPFGHLYGVFDAKKSALLSLRNFYVEWELETSIRSMHCLGTDGLFPSATMHKIHNKYIFRAARAKNVPQTETRVVKFWLNETSYNVTRCSNPNACPHFP